MSGLGWAVHTIHPKKFVASHKPGIALFSMTTLYHPPMKHSVEIAGHKTSISLEPIFWELLQARASEDAIPVNALIARIDAERILVENPPGLASAIRVWLVAEALD